MSQFHYSDPSIGLLNFTCDRALPADLSDVSLLPRTNHSNLNWDSFSVRAYQTPLRERQWDHSGIPRPRGSVSSCTEMDSAIGQESRQQLSPCSLQHIGGLWNHSMPELNRPSICASASDGESVPPSSPQEPNGNSINVPTVPKIPQAVSISVPTRCRRKKSDDSDLRAQYPCDFCSVRMSRLHDINRHMRLHTNEKPYECLGCGQTFRRTDARARHWTKHESCASAHRIREPVGTRTRQRISLRI